MYDYLYRHGFPKKFGGNIELYVSEKDDDEAEWRMWLYDLDEVDIAYQHHGEYFYMIWDWLLDELENRYPELRVVRVVYEE